MQQKASLDFYIHFSFNQKTMISGIFYYTYTNEEPKGGN